jgi:hypothetical protein
MDGGDHVILVGAVVDIIEGVCVVLVYLGRQ